MMSDRSLHRLLALQITVGLSVSQIPMLRPGGYPGILCLGLVVSLLFPLGWLAARSLHVKAPARRAALFLALGSAPAAVLLLLAVVHTRRCEIPQGLAMLFLGHLPGMLFCFGLVELLSARARWPKATYLLAWIVLVAAAIGPLVSGPTMRAASPLCGMLLGSLYRRPEVVAPRTLFMALETLAFAAALLGASRPLAPGWRGHVPWVVPATIGLALCAGSPELGHRIGSRQILEELSTSLQDGPHRHHLSRFLPTDATAWLLTEARFHWERHLRLLHLDPERQPARLYWYDGRSQIETLTGAPHPYSKPYLHGEVHVIASDFPPRSLAHELAHAAVAPLTGNPFGLPGRLGGLWYHPALTEGLAVALAWGDDATSAHETAGIALDAGRVPPLPELFAPWGFFVHNLGVSYEASGSFIRYCLDAFGVDPVARFTRTLDFEASFGRPLPEVEREWKAMLAALPPLPDDVSFIDEAQSMPPIAAEDCGESWRLDLSRAQMAKADEEVERLLADVDDASRPMAALSLLQYRAERSRYLIELPETPPPGLSPPQEHRYRFLRALSAWARNDRNGADAILASLPDGIRSSEDVVLARILIRDGYGVDVLKPGAARLGVTQLQAIWDQDRHPAVGYLLARMLRGGRRWESLHELLPQLSWDGFPFPDDRSGPLPMTLHLWRAETSFALRQWDRAEAAAREAVELAPSEGRRSAVLLWLDRIAYFRAHADALAADLPAWSPPMTRSDVCRCRTW